MRIGQGFDAHPFVGGRPLILGGVLVAHPKGLDGDSDGDVLTHAIMDALLGALALGDLGTWFRADDPTVHGARSTDLLMRVMAMVRERGYSVAQVDTTVIGEKPKVRPLVPSIRDALSPILMAAPEDISIKATTTDQMGWLGREEGLAALALVQLQNHND
ncbi:2-C-methyl-D-erythritol 2,4-cyclodiphosphate synthase [Sulfobacillus harzensis]|uniref:2-C-methyl-D-erythritol 2,4-cyclodiphosphate synthase n=1 Tax=Sulfobacillus harzensis TaxID=2729629 RepID=A0A7Y0L5B5_9FIRM|nr:2-C-methyl-D-erythritol 2,4-cyclodiphosphate synthase [Sulfobacillus harzensis]NMP22164.1 2-C-methyl-D-erythritol 2,4-cyclodiphosphate synthase [Sulfobacillus harzensis]